MGQQELFAKRIFAEETARITRGAATWEDPPEIRLEKVQSDGLLMVHRPTLLAPLTPPWPEARSHAEVMVELKLAGDKVDRRRVERALLRRQARQVQRIEDETEDTSWMGHEPLWLVAPHVPEWLREAYTPTRLAPGCYQVQPPGGWFLWVAANELPLRDELIPFLVARSGLALDEFGRWVADRRPLDWVLSMLESLTMSSTVQEELLSRFPPTSDPEVLARRRRNIQLLLASNPEVKEELVKEGIERGRLDEARAALRRVLARRQLELSPEDEARIEQCTDREALERWLDRAITASSVDEALR